MNDDFLVSIIQSTARAIFDQPSLTYDGDLAFRDILGFDSVQAVQFILAIETATGETLSEDEVDRMHTLGAALEILKEKKQNPV